MTGESELLGEFVDAQADTLFSVATVCDVDPPVVKRWRSPWQAVCTMNEDDWRQIEFASAGLAPTISRMLSVLREMRQQHGRQVHDNIVAFDRMFARSGPKRPLDGRAVSFASLRESLGVRKINRRLRTGLLAHSSPGCTFANGFAALTAGGSRLYGILRGDLIEVLGTIDVATDVDGPLLCDFARRHDLVLVNWNRASIATFDDASFVDLLN